MQSKLAAGVAMEDALEDDGVEDASLHASWRDKAEIPAKKKTSDKQTDVMNEFPVWLGLNRVSYQVFSLQLNCIFFGEGQTRSVYLGCKFCW
jgi:hypothetical protein